MAAQASGESLSPFEELISKHTPVFNNLLLHLPTSALLDLYHTSRFLRAFLRSYPTAWAHLSFRLPFVPMVANYSTRVHYGTVMVWQPVARESKALALDQLLSTVVNPLGTCLRALDLDETAVSGYALTTTVLATHKSTLQHLSVRGCKNVSLKYHILPFLRLQRILQSSNPLPAGNGPNKIVGLALKSLYVYRCRHHRRRPYNGLTLARKECDAQLTHELINLCHDVGIWTDTAWCTTPGHRCPRRRDCYLGQSTHMGKEIWVIFDRLWRCSNRLGLSRGGLVDLERSFNDGRLWEEEEYGYDGEPLGSGIGTDKGEGKLVPAHLRRSHSIFVEDVTCYQCGEAIPERCEQCSVYMHCLGCRKTLCGSCAYDRPSAVYLTKAAAAERSLKKELWWAPLAQVSPNDVNEGNDLQEPLARPHSVRLRFKWCCVAPIMSTGSNILLAGHISLGLCKGRLRTAPLPRGEGYEEYYFSPSGTEAETSNVPSSSTSRALNSESRDPLLLLQPSLDRRRAICPRNLCQECRASDVWRVECSTCHYAICRDHGTHSPKMMVCGHPNLMPKVLRVESRFAIEFAAKVALPDGSDDDLLCPQMPVDEKDPTELGDVSGNVDAEARGDPPLPPSPLPQEIAQTTSVWKGCGAFVCSSKCWGKGKECGKCGVYKCSTCEAANPQCDCSKCEQNPLCPNCYFKFQDTDCALGAQAQLIQERKEFFERPLAHYYEPKLTRQVKDAEGNTVWVPRDD